MSNILTIPKGTNILDYLHELDGTNERTKNAWLIMHRNVVENLMQQTESFSLAPALALASGDCSFDLNSTNPSQRIGAISFRTAPCIDENRQTLWFLVTEIYLDEDSHIKIAFRSLSPYPTEAIFLTLEE